MTEHWQPDAVQAALVARARLLTMIRAFFRDRDVLEVDTPVLAAAAPSEAQLACFAVDDGAGYLVPSPEHGLKRLLAAGSGPIYQLGHVFRAGEIGRWHNPEFTMLEWYRPGGSMATLIAEVQALLAAVTDTNDMTHMSYAELFTAETGLDAHRAEARELAAHARGADLAPPVVSAAEERSRPFWLDLIMSTTVTPQLGFDAPVCITDFPVDDAVLVRVRDEDPPVAERFEIYWHGQELANGAEELTDADVARQRMQREHDSRAVVGLAQPPMDEKLLAAMAHGLPACTGVALGVDRLLAITLGAQRLADVLPFAWDKR